MFTIRIQTKRAAPITTAAPRSQSVRSSNLMFKLSKYSIERLKSFNSPIINFKYLTSQIFAGRRLRLVATNLPTKVIHWRVESRYKLIYLHIRIRNVYVCMGVSIISTLFSVATFDSAVSFGFGSSFSSCKYWAIEQSSSSSTKSG